MDDDITTTQVVETHRHLCPKCRVEYPGYTPVCQESKALLCYRCLAETYQPPRRRSKIYGAARVIGAMGAVR